MGPCVYIALQAYLVNIDEDLQDLIDWARKENLPIKVRLVKEIYRNYETTTCFF